MSANDPHPADYQAETLSYYDTHAHSFVAGTLDADMSAALDRFVTLLPTDGHVLDWGCGSGRDSLAMSERGLLVQAVDASPTICYEAAERGVSVRQETFGELEDMDAYDGIWACASLLHLKRADLPDAFARAARALKERGVLYCSFKLGDFEGMRGGRWFTYLREEDLAELLEPHFAVLRMWTSGDVRPERANEQWLNCLVVKRMTVGGRLGAPVDAEASSVVAFTQSKRGGQGPSGDAILVGDAFCAVIDGATPKGERLWGPSQMPGDAFVAEVLSSAISSLDPQTTATEAIGAINEALTEAYRAEGLDYASLAPVERFEASVVIYSVTRREVWIFGDCQALIDGRSCRNGKEVEQVLASLRALYVALRRCDDGSYDPGSDPDDYGRQMILPLLKEQAKLANSDGAFGFDVLDGWTIHPQHVKVFAVRPGDHVVLASDGYPKLFDTLAESEKYLRQALAEDPGCVGALRGTKSLAPGNVSFDDRSFVSFEAR